MNNKTTELDELKLASENNQIPTAFDDGTELYNPPIFSLATTTDSDEELDDSKEGELVNKLVEQSTTRRDAKNHFGTSADPIVGYSKSGVAIGKSAKGIAYLIQGLFPLMAVVFLIATSNAGKTTLALSLAMAVAGYLPMWAGMRIASRKRGVVYITCEGAEGIEMRIKANSQYFCNVDGLDNFFLMYLAKSDFSEPEAALNSLIARIEETIGNTEIALIILDTLPGIIHGRENDSEFATKTMNLLQVLAEHFGATVMPLTHVSLSNENNATGAHEVKGRGSTAFRAAADSSLGLFPHPEEKILEAATNKVRDGRPTETLYFEFKEVNVELEPNNEADCPEDTTHGTTVVLDYIDSATAEERLKNGRKGCAEDNTCSRLYKAWIRGGIQKSDDSRLLPIITRDALRAVLYEEGMSRTKVTDALRTNRASLLQSLLDDGILLPAEKPDTYLVTEATAYKLIMIWRNEKSLEPRK